MPSCPARQPVCLLHPLCAPALSGCSPALHRSHDSPLSDSWARLAPASLNPPLFWRVSTSYTDLPRTVWRLRHQPQESPQRSCPMTGTAVTSVCQLRDSVSRRNLIIAQEWREGEGQCRLEGTHRKLACSVAQTVSARSHQDWDPQENKYDPGRPTATHSLWKSSCS